MKVGDVVPNFCLLNENGEEVELYKSLTQKVLLVFYPKDDTPVCSSQLAEYNENFDEFINHGIKIIGINSDTHQSHSDFSSKLQLKFPLLSDTDKKISGHFGAINIFGLTKRKLVLIGPDKKVLWAGTTLPVTYLKTEEILKNSASVDSKEMT
jgi:peroxiredoxin